MQDLSDDVALHKVDFDNIYDMAGKLAASCSVEMVTAEASQLVGHFQAVASSVQVTASISHVYK